MTDAGSAEPPPPQYIWRTVIGRSAFKFEVLLLGEQRSYFLSEEFLAGAFVQRKRLQKLNTLNFFAALALAWILLAPTNLISSIALQFGGVALPAGIVTKQVLFFALAVFWSYVCLTMLSYFLCMKMIDTIYRAAFGDQGDLFATKYDAYFLWREALMPHVVGYKSPKFHLFMALISGVIAIAIGIAEATFVGYASWKTFDDLIAASHTRIDIALTCLSSFILASTTLLTVLALYLPLKFSRDQ